MPAMEIKASDVQKLRQTTGAGLMDCKKALTETNGDFEKAVKYLREQGIAKSAKRADRLAGEGLIDTWISDDQKEGIILELNCETDFVAKNDEFKKMLSSLLEMVKKNPSWNDVKEVPQDPIKELSAKTGEKVEFKKFGRLKAKAGIIASYVHAGSKLAVLLSVESNKAGGPSENLKELARELTLQIAGANPAYIHRDEVPADIIQTEKDIVLKQLEGQKKPPEILEKIAIGKLNVFYESQCLLDQPHVRDSSGKTKIKDLVSSAAKKDGAEYKVAKFIRYRVGAE